jgi:hypothetical protein
MQVPITYSKYGTLPSYLTTSLDTWTSWSSYSTIKFQVLQPRPMNLQQLTAKQTLLNLCLRVASASFAMFVRLHLANMILVRLSSISSDWSCGQLTLDTCAGEWFD